MGYLVSIITTGRSDYGHLVPVIDRIVEQNLNYEVVFPANHPAVDEIMQNYNFYQLGCGFTCAEEYGIYQKAFFDYFFDVNPSVIIVLGDRFELHAAVTAATLYQVPNIFHIHGGEVTKGSFDNELRNSITQMSTHHFTSHVQYAVNVSEMKRDPWFYDFLEEEIYCNGEPQASTIPDVAMDLRIFNVGAPILDNKTPVLSKKSICSVYNIPEDYILACFNPETKELNLTEEHTLQYLSALFQINMPTIIIQPNIDPANGIIRKMNEESQYYNTRLVECIPQNMFRSLMANCSVMVGNSSAGIIESGQFGIPVVNIGNRQNGRLLPANVISVPCETHEIIKAIKKSLTMDRKPCSIYGDGYASDRIMEVLKEVLGE